MRFTLFKKAARASLFLAVLAATFMPSVVPVFAWTGPTTAAPGGNTAAPVNVSGTNQAKLGSLTLGQTGFVGYPFSVNGQAGNWTGVFNWPPASAPASSYGILVGASAGGYSEFESATGYYTQIDDSSWGILTNGNVDAADYYDAVTGQYLSTTQSHLFGGMFSQYSVGGCTGPNAYGTGCGCPGFAPNAGFLAYTFYGSNPVAQYYCY